MKAPLIEEKWFARGSKFKLIYTAGFVMCLDKLMIPANTLIYHAIGKPPYKFFVNVICVHINFDKILISSVIPIRASDLPSSLPSSVISWHNLSGNDAILHCRHGCTFLRNDRLKWCSWLGGFVSVRTGPDQLLLLLSRIDGTRAGQKATLIAH